VDAAAGDADNDARVEVARPLNVEVEVAPVLTPDGPTTIGTTICRVLPLLSVVVFVMVERMVLVNGCASLPPFDDLRSLCLLLVGVAGLGVCCWGSSSASPAAA
jgi:hypothetical protein